MTVVDSGGLREQSAAPVSPPRLRWTRGDIFRTAISLLLAVALVVTAFALQDVTDPVTRSPATFALLIGTALGIVFERGRFCFYCIFRDAFEKKNTRGLYSILTAIAVGSIGYVLVFSIRLPDPTTGALPGGAHIAPVSLALVFAGFAFGIGVVLSHGCIAGHLYRLGEGSLRAIPALIGAMVGFGVGFLTWNPIYDAFIARASSPWLPTGGGYALALLLQLGVLGAIGVWLLRWNPPLPAVPERVIDGPAIRRSLFFRRWPTLVTGALVGLIGVAAYLRDRPLGVTSQLSSLTRTGMTEFGLLPDTLRGLDATLAGCVAIVVETITSNGWLILGIVVGSLAAALPGRRFRIEPVNIRQSSTAVVGGVFLGWGAITGLGCTVGVVLSGSQALAVSGWVFSAALVLALWVGFRFGLHRL